MQKELPFPVLPRDLELPVDSGKIITATGVRRCGKSSMMKIVANKLMKQGVDPKRILWINFDDERLDGMLTSELDEMLQAYREMFPEIPLSEVYMFFDEIQGIEKWELFVLRVYKSYCRNIWLSGSNAKMLSSQIATALRGWPIEFEAYPLSFHEFLRFRGVEVSAFDESGRALLVKLCREYLHTSAFPELVLMSEESLKIRKLQGYFNTMLFRDLIEHFDLPNPVIVKYFLKRLMENLTKPTSINSIFNDLKSQGRKIDKNRLYEWAEMACETFLFFKVSRWSASLIKETTRLPKYYFADNGMRNAIMLPQSRDDGKLLENLVFLHLKRHLEPSQKISYFSEGAECDFVVQREEAAEVLIQVCTQLGNPDTLRRELRGLTVAAGVTSCHNCKIITLDEEEIIQAGELTIEVLPAWKWLLRNPYDAGRESI